MKKRQQPLDLPDLLKKNRNALTVYGALVYLANGKKQLNITRPTITDVCHLSPKVISPAMAALHDAGWITRRYGKSGDSHRSWYRITFNKSGTFPVVPKTTLRGRPRGTKNDPQGVVPCGTKNDPHSLERVGGRPTDAAPPLEGGTASDAQEGDQHPTREDIERQKRELEANKAARAREKQMRGKLASFPTCTEGRQ